MTARRWVLLVGAAAIAALIPLPPPLIERWYSNGVYPPVQHVLTSASNLIPISLFDVACVAAVAVLLIVLVRAIRGAGWLRGAAITAVRVIAAAAAVYLIFLACWGLNYRRVPLQDKVAFEEARLTVAATNAFGARVVSELNALYLPAHAANESLDTLAGAFETSLRALHTRPIVVGRPKQTLLGGYFHAAAIAGMTDPFFLETLIAPDLLDVERPFVIAHEWAHLAGYADESEANFVAWLTCTRATPRAQYSAWLALFGHALSAAQGKRAILRAMQPGPRIDLQAIADRYAQTPRVVRFAARETYDRYLKANRVERGVESYDAVIELIVGTQFGGEGFPEMK
jgi:Protein of unknown function (DUF3810)